MTQKQVYLSFHESDFPLAERLDNDLLKRGIQASSERSIEPGESRPLTIKQQILESDCFIACLSPQYLADEFSRTQLFLARAYRKRVLPILVAQFTEGQSPRFDLMEAGQAHGHALKGLEELDIADFSGLYPIWGMGSYERNFERLVEVIQPVPKPEPLNSKLIYVSYHWTEQEFAMRLAKDLELARGNVWIDKRNIEVGSSWRSEMYHGLQKADYFILCLSPEAAQSENVNHEVLVANLRKIPVYAVVSERMNSDPNMIAAIKSALKDSTEMRWVGEQKWFTPKVSYEAMLHELKTRVGLDPNREETKDGIFISYRRADSQAVTGRIHEHLVREFGPKNVFVDVDSIPPGTDFSEYYRKWVTARAAVMLVIVGSKWASVKKGKDPAEIPRIQQDGDHVRIEVATALTQDDLMLVPVLVDGAKMPSVKELPDDLVALRKRNSLAVRHDPDFERDMQKLIRTIRATEKN